MRSNDQPECRVFEALFCFHSAQQWLPVDYPTYKRSSNWGSRGRLASELSKRTTKAQDEEFDGFARWIGSRPTYIKDAGYEGFEVFSAGGEFSF